MSRTAVDVLEMPQRAAEEETELIRPKDDEDEDMDSVGEDRDEESEMDETEMELERVVFGDSAGFRKGLKASALAVREDEADTDEQEVDGLDDADLFFADIGDSAELAPAPATVSDDEDTTLRSKHPPAWEDSDDERMLVSLASVPRLRKLRRTEAEDVVNGKEYAKRLRRQFEMLHPSPEWAREAMRGPARKKRRVSEGAESDNAASDEDMGMDEDLPSAAPLSKLLQNAESLVRQSGPGKGKKRKLRPEVIDIQRTKDIPGIQPSAITSLSFHPKLPLLLSSGPSSTLYLHHISPSPPAPTPNPLLTSMHIRNTPFTTTAFHPTDGRIFLSARRRYFHVWNLHTGQVEKISRVYGQQHEQRTMEHFKLSPDGNHMALLGSAKKGGGVINILSAGSLQWITQARVESRGGIADFCWWRDGRGMAIAAKNGEVTEWSVVEQRVVARWQDEGAVGTTTIALGGQHEFNKSAFGNDRWIAVGSSSGIVNLYDRRVWLASPPQRDSTSSEQPIPVQPKPTRTLDHLTTPTSHLVFSPDGQLMVMASKWKRDALRLVHLPSCTVFKNWPTSSTPLGRITGVTVAGGEVMGEAGKEGLFALMAVANEQGKVRVWEIR